MLIGVTWARLVITWSSNSRLRLVSSFCDRCNWDCRLADVRWCVSCRDSICCWNRNGNRANFSQMPQYSRSKFSFSGFSGIILIVRATNRKPRKTEGLNETRSFVVYKAPLEEIWVPAYCFQAECSSHVTTYFRTFVRTSESMLCRGSNILCESNRPVPEKNIWFIDSFPVSYCYFSWCFGRQRTVCLTSLRWSDHRKRKRHQQSFVGINYAQWFMIRALAQVKSFKLSTNNRFL